MQAQPDNRPTYAIAAEQIAAYVQPLWPGALALPFAIRDDDGRRLGMVDDHLWGKSLVLVFLNDASEAAHNRALKRSSDFDWPVAGDSTKGTRYNLNSHLFNEDSLKK